MQEKIERIKKKDQVLARTRSENLEKKKEKADNCLKLREKAIADGKKNLYLSETKREVVRKVLDFMAIWNAWNVDIIEDVVKKYNGNTDITEITREVMKHRKFGLKKLESNIGLNRIMTPKMVTSKCMQTGTTFPVSVSPNSTAKSGWNANQRLSTHK